MDTLIGLFDSMIQSQLLQVTLPFIAAVIAWLVNERRKRAWEEYQRKEEHYKALLTASRGFYEDSEDKAKKAAFLEQVDFCWLYCSDEVIKRAYKFLEAVRSGATTTKADRLNAFGSLMVAIRQDMLKRKVARKSSLQPADYQIFTAS